MFKNKMKFGLIRTSFGRVVFHLVCLCCDGKFRWHLAGVMRELRHQPVFENPLKLQNSNHSTNMKKPIKLLAALALVILAQPIALHAGSHTWSGANSIYFNDGSNWSYGGAPAAGEQNVYLYFPAGVTRYTCSNNIYGLTVSSINISGNNYAIEGNPITVTSNITDSGDLNGIASPLVLGNSNITVNVSAGVTLYLNGVISGTGGLTKVGLGTLQYNWTDYNSYTGTTYINSGTFVMSRGISEAAIVGPLVVGTPVGSPGTAIAKVLFGSQISHTSIVTVNFTGVLQLTTDPDWIAGLIMAGGTVDTGTGMLALMGDVSIQSGASTINGKLELYQTNRVFNADPGGALTINATINDAAGSAGIIKTGAGSLTLAGSNTFTGPVLVKAGYLTLEHNLALSHASGLTVTNNGIVQLSDVNITNIYAMLSGNGNGNGALRAFGTNVWDGGITLSANSGIQCLASNDLLTVSKWIDGKGGLTKLGAGKLILAGSSGNTHQGTTTVSQGTLQLSKSNNAVAIPGPLIIGDSTNAPGTRVVSLTAAKQIADQADVIVNASGRLDMNASFSLSDTIGSLAGSGGVNLGLGGSLAVGTNNASTTFSGSLTGWGGTFTKQGAGTLTLSGNNVNFLGYVVVASGELSVNGDLSNAQMTVNSGAMLDGSGVVGQIVDAGMLSPGNSPGLLTSKDASFTPGSAFNVQLNGVNPGVSYDQLNVIGVVTLSNVTLNATLGFAGAVSNQFVVIQNDSTDAIVGTFNGLPEGAVFAIGGTPFQITYKGGQGNNDIVLTQIGLPTPPQIGAITPLVNGQMQLSGTGLQGLSYTVQANDDLNTTNWINLGVIAAGQGGSLAFTDTDATNHAMRFYRFRAN